MIISGFKKRKMAFYKILLIYSMTATGATYIDINVDLLTGYYFNNSGVQSLLGYVSACCNIIFFSNQPLRDFKHFTFPTFRGSQKVKARINMTIPSRKIWKFRLSIKPSDIFPPLRPCTSGRVKVGSFSLSFNDSMRTVINNIELYYNPSTNILAGEKSVIFI